MKGKESLEDRESLGSWGMVRPDYCPWNCRKSEVPSLAGNWKNYPYSDTQKYAAHFLHCQARNCETGMCWREEVGVSRRTDCGEWKGRNVYF